VLATNSDWRNRISDLSQKGIGGKRAVPLEMIDLISKLYLQIPLIVGGGIVIYSELIRHTIKT
jgi:hypothetical protein